MSQISTSIVTVGPPARAIGQQSARGQQGQSHQRKPHSPQPESAPEATPDAATLPPDADPAQPHLDIKG